MKKPAFCIWENKATDQLHSYCAVYQRLCFHYIYIVQSLYFLNLKFEAFSRFVLDLVGNPEDRFSRDLAHL